MKYLTQKQRDDIGLRILHQLKEHRFSKQQLATIIQKDENFVEGVCSGQTDCDIIEYIRIARALGIPDYELTGIRDLTPYWQSAQVDWNTIREAFDALMGDSFEPLCELLEELYDGIDEGYVEGNTDDVAHIIQSMSIIGNKLVKIQESIESASPMEPT